MQDREVDDLLALAARARLDPSPDLVSLVLADASACQPRARVPALPPRRLGLLARLADMLGGPPVLAGVCSTLILGLTLGYLNPAAASYLTGGATGAETLELFPSSHAFATEG